MNPFRERREILRSISHVARSSKPPEQQAWEHRPLACRRCGEAYPMGQWSENMYVCPACGQHEPVSAKARIRMTVDAGSFREFNRGRTSRDPLQFPEYKEKLRELRKQTGLKEAVITGTARIDGVRTVLCVMDKRFLMASMGTAVGEKISLAFEYATKKKLPVVVFAASGGARMQEGIFSLMQMARTSAAVARHDEAGLLYIAVLTHPTTGGVTASFASLGDITLAEPGALIGFAGPRVIEQTIGETLPEGFQSAEFQEEKGFVDRITTRQEMREVLGRLLRIHSRR